MSQTIKRLLVANRDEIAIRVMRAANELGIQTIAVYADEDKLALHRFKADEIYLIGQGHSSMRAYLAIPKMLRIATLARADTVHPGYGVLSENPEFADAVIAAGLTWVDPRPETMHLLGNKVATREAAQAAGVHMVPASTPCQKTLPRRQGGC